jgi:uncharacterized protein YukE
MSSFSVEPDGLRRLATALDDAGGDCGAIQWHAREDGMVKGGAGLLGELKSDLDAAYEWAQETPQRIMKLLVDTALGIEHAAKEYANTDQAAAARTDALVAPLDRYAKQYYDLQPRPRGGGAAFRPQYSVQQRLAVNAPHTQTDYQYSYNVLTDSLSVSGNLRGLIHKLFGYDFFEFFLKRASGDWDGLVKAADTMDKCGSAIDLVGRNLVADSNDLPGFWSGNAGDRARDYLGLMGRAVSQRRPQYEHIAKTFRDLASQAWVIFDALGIALGSLLDKLAEVALKAAAGTASFETVVGAIIGYGAAAWAAKQATELVVECIDLMEKVDNLVKTAKAALAGVASVGGPGPAPSLQLPQAPYTSDYKPGDPGFVGPVNPPKPGAPGFTGPEVPPKPGDPYYPTPSRPGDPGFIGPVDPPKPGDPGFIGPVG